MKRQRPEDALQRQAAAFLDTALPHGAAWFAVPNGGARSKTEAAIMAGLGVKAGAPDLLVFWDGKCFAIELKAEHGRLSETQKEMHASLRRADIPVNVCTTLHAMVTWLESWGVPFKGRIAA